MVELTRRLRAARVYAGLDQRSAAKRISALVGLGFSPATYERIDRGKRDPKPLEVEPIIKAAVDVFGLPREFFTTDYSQLEVLTKRLESALSEPAPPAEKDDLGDLPLDEPRPGQADPRDEQAPGGHVAEEEGH